MSKRPCRRGAISGKPPENEPWVWITRELMQSTTWGALSISARRILDAILLEHLSNGGRENGNLAVTQRQLEAFGVSKHDIGRGIEELQICGFLRLVRQGLRGHAGAEPSRYAVTWLVTFLNSPQAAIPTDDWREVVKANNRAGRVTVRQVRAWLKSQVAHKSRGASKRSKRKPQPQDIEGAPHLRGNDREQVWGANPPNVVPITPHLRGETGTSVGLRT